MLLNEDFFLNFLLFPFEKKIKKKKKAEAVENGVSAKTR